MFPQGRCLVIVDGSLTSLLACASAREAALGAATARGRRPRAREGANPGSGTEPPPIAWIPCFWGASKPGSGPTAESGQPESPGELIPSLRAAIRSGNAGPAIALARTIAAERQANLLGLQVVRSEAKIDPDSRGPSESHLLLAAVADAAREGCSHVVWPVLCTNGTDHGLRAADSDVDVDAVARVIDRALLVTRLASLDLDEQGSLSPEVRAPYADLTDHQAAELAMDMDLPVHLCWWWGPVLEAQGGTPTPNLTPDAGRIPLFARGPFSRWTSVLESVGYLAGTPHA